MMQISKPFLQHTTSAQPAPPKKGGTDSVHCQHQTNVHPLKLMFTHEPNLKGISIKERLVFNFAALTHLHHICSQGKLREMNTVFVQSIYQGICRTFARLQVAVSFFHARWDDFGRFVCPTPGFCLWTTLPPETPEEQTHAQPLTFVGDSATWSTTKGIRP